MESVLFFVQAFTSVLFWTEISDMCVIFICSWILTFVAHLSQLPSEQDLSSLYSMCLVWGRKGGDNLAVLNSTFPPQSYRFNSTRCGVLVVYFI